MEITQRDGGGTWGGRVLQAYVDGYYPSGNSAHISMSISTMQSLFGGGRSNWFDISHEPVGPLPPTRGGSVVASTPTSVQTFWVSGNGDLIEREWVSGSGFGPVADLGQPPSGELTWDPSAATSGGGRIDLVMRDAHGMLVTLAYIPGSGWTDWRPTTVTMASSPAAVSPVSGELDIYYKGADGRIYTYGWTHLHGWSAPAAVPGITNAASGPAVVAPVAGSLRQALTYRDAAGALWLANYLPGTGWSAPVPVSPGSPAPAMAAVDPGMDGNGAGRFSVYVTGTDGIVYHSGYTLSSGSWSVWYPVAGQGVTSSVSGWSTSSGVTLIGQYRGAMATQAWTPAAGWRTWVPL